jgi:hypothetical protein
MFQSGAFTHPFGSSRLSQNGTIFRDTGIANPTTTFLFLHDYAKSPVAMELSTTD